MSQTENPSPKSLGAALNEAQSIIESAEVRAAELRRAAEGAYEDAKRSGYQAGYQQGLRDVSGTAVRLIEDTTRIRDDITEEAAKLAVAICGSIIAEHVRVDPTVVKKIAERALQQSVVGDSITIVCNPEDQPILSEAIPNFQRLSGGSRVGVETSTAVARGGCTVRTEFGDVDASLPTLIESIALHLGIGPTR